VSFKKTIEKKKVDPWSAFGKAEEEKEIGSKAMNSVVTVREFKRLKELTNKTKLGKK